jgi:hypothetical protein
MELEKKKISKELEQIVTIAFDKYDKDKSGALTEAELSKLLREICGSLNLRECSEEEMQILLHMIDDSGDGEIQCDELLENFAEVMDWLMVNLGKFDIKGSDIKDNPHFIRGLGKQIKLLERLKRSKKANEADQLANALGGLAGLLNPPNEGLQPTETLMGIKTPDIENEFRPINSMMNNPGREDDFGENSKSPEIKSRTKSRVQIKTELSISQGDLSQRDLSPPSRSYKQVRIKSLEKMPLQDIDVDVSEYFENSPASLTPKIESEEGQSPESQKWVHDNVFPSKKSSFGLKSEFVNLVNKKKGPGMSAKLSNLDISKGNDKMGEKIGSKIDSRHKSLHQTQPGSPDKRFQDILSPLKGRKGPPKSPLHVDQNLILKMKGRSMGGPQKTLATILNNSVMS